MSEIKNDKLFVNGMLVLLCSVILFCLPLFFSTFKSIGFGLFFLNFAFAIGYLIALKASRRLKGQENMRVQAVCLLLFFISAYALNRDVTVFSESADWFAILLITISCNYLLFSIFKILPTWIRHGMFLLLGVAIILFIYLCLYLFPVYAMALLCSPALGISLLVFVPAFFLRFSILLFASQSLEERKLRWSGFAGMAASLAIIIIFTTLWDREVTAINSNYRKAQVNAELLPAWIDAARKLPNNFISEKILQSDLVYETPNPDNFFWTVKRMNFGSKIHDPLVAIGNLISGGPAINEEDRIRILESRFDARHNTEPRLWSGEDLVTEYVHTNLKLWPEYAMAYTEKTITVFADRESENFWRRESEAIYTFQLPEGGVVTSLSLWINGEEEKGVLTTRGKADKAYNTIVGVEYRDPSLVKWQEGNRVSVRVFPVLGGARRTFKIGITSPLRIDGKELVYENISFKGPELKGTREDVQVALTRSYQGGSFQSFTSNDDKHFERSGKYKPDWSIRVDNAGISNAAFSFQGKSYRVSDVKQSNEKFNSQSVYLDINSAWKKEEYDLLVKECAGKKLFAGDDELVQITAENKDKVFEKLSRSLFSLFPFFRIADPDNALVLSKSTRYSPNLRDLEGSRFLAATRSFFSGSPNLRVYNLDTEVSPYLRTLLEYRAINYLQGDMQNLLQMLAKSEYPTGQEDSTHIILPTAHIMITETEEETASQAPDHLLRLFAYNHLMQAAGKRMLDTIPEDDALIGEAKRANIVTPVSSLIVLESNEDYERFKITKNIDALGNASLKSKGAVPEPHEWLLIIVGAIVLFYISIKTRFTGARH